MHEEKIKMNTNNNEVLVNKKPHVSSVVVYPPMIYLGGLVLGLILDLLIPIRIESRVFFVPIGLIFLTIATILISWAQHTSRKFNKKDEKISNDFYKGPYKFSRNPTYLGLTFLVIGFGFIINSLFVAIFTILSFIITHFLFVRKEENILKEKYGEHYLEYKKSVRSWF